MFFPYDGEESPQEEIIMYENDYIRSEDSNSSDINDYNIIFQEYFQINQI